MDTIECVVVGAGVIGLAIARAIARAGLETIIVERETAFGMGTSSRNSEVIHAGIYYPKGSLRAQFCVAGKAMLYEQCESHGVTHVRCGKLIVATEEDQVATLATIRAAAHGNGVTDVEWADIAAVRAAEPELRAVAALRSPSTGIVDSHGYMLSLLGDAEAMGAVLAVSTELEQIFVEEDGFALRFAGEAAPSIKAKRLVNAAGLYAPALAGRIEGLDSAHVPPTIFAKGSYFALAGKSPFRTLVYPVPVVGGLGVHLTLDTGGQARFGPDVEWLAGTDIDYAVEPVRGDSFYAAIRSYWPGLPDGALVPAYSGVRPKLSRPPEPAADFRIDGPDVHGVPGLVNLFGIESPGLTSSLAIAEYVKPMLL